MGDSTKDSLSITESLEKRKYCHSTIIKEGILEKWTNFLGTWKPRYFIVEPGVLKYADGPGKSIKSIYPLILCTLRSSCEDPYQLIISHGHGVLYLRINDLDDKKQWIDALNYAKNVFQHPQSFTNGSFLLKNWSSSTSLENKLNSTSSTKAFDFHDYEDINVHSTNDLSDEFQYEESQLKGYSICTGDDLDSIEQPILRLVQNFNGYRQTLESVSKNIEQIQTHILNLAVIQKNVQFKNRFQNLSFRLIQLLDFIKLISDRQAASINFLAKDEYLQRKVIEKSLHNLAKENYELKTIFSKMKSIISLYEKTNDINQNSTIPFANGSKPVNDVSLYAQLIPLLNLNLPGQYESCIPANSQNDPIFNNDKDDSESDSFKDSDFFDIEEEFDFKSHNISLLNSVDSQSISYSRDEILPNESDIAGFPIQRRTKLPTQRSDIKVSLWSVLKDCIGKDLSRISVPVCFNEPTSFLQRLAEDYTYVSLLKEAYKKNSISERLINVTAFSITPYSLIKSRTYKPFNPLLGETYEISHRGFRFVAEQVEHHPPVTAFFADSNEFEIWGDLSMKTKFTGKSIEIALSGNYNIFLRSPMEENSSHGEWYVLQRPKSIVNNIIFGKLSLDAFGSVLISSLTTGECALVEYIKQKWWNDSLDTVRGIIFDTMGFPQFKLGGTYVSEIWVEKITNSGLHKITQANLVPHESNINYAPFIESNTFSNTEFLDKSYMPEFWFLPKPKYSPRNVDSIKVNWESIQSDSSSRRIIWQAPTESPNLPLYYGFTQMTMELNELSPEYDINQSASMPPTDSRYRLDQRYLENGDIELANQEKKRLESNQRIRYYNREKEKKSYKPRWFQKLNNETVLGPWFFTGEYWEAKSKNQFTQCVNIFE